MTTTAIIPLAEGTRIRYSYQDVDGLVTIEGVKARPVGMSRLGNQGFVIVSDDGSETPISRYAQVETI